MSYLKLDHNPPKEVLQRCTTLFGNERTFTGWANGQSQGSTNVVIRAHACKNHTFSFQMSQNHSAEPKWNEFDEKRQMNRRRSHFQYFGRTLTTLWREICLLPEHFLQVMFYTVPDILEIRGRIKNNYRLQNLASHTRQVWAAQAYSSETIRQGISGLCFHATSCSSLIIFP